MNKLFLLALLLLIPLASAIDQSQVPIIAKQNAPYDIKIPCQANGGWFCGTTTVCNLSVYYPNSSALVNNQLMTLNGAVFNYTLWPNQTSVLGRFTGDVKCTDPTTALNGSTDFLLIFTPNGAFDDSIGYFILFGVGLIFTIGLIVIGFYQQEAYITLFGSLGLTLFGLYMFANGIGIYRNTITEPTGLITMFVAAYIGLRTAMEIAEVNLNL